MPQRRPHNRRFEHVELEIVWAGIETLDVALRSVLLRELATDLSCENLKVGHNPNDRVRYAVISLRVASDLFGAAPSILRYRELRAALPELDLMPDPSIRRALGEVGWNECLRRALLDAVTDGDFTSRSINEAFTQDELVAAIRDYMVEHDDAVPTLLELVGWAHDPRVKAKPGRRPLTQTPFGRFGGYPAVLRAAGVGPNVRRNIVGRVLAVTYRYSDADLREAVRAVGQKLGRSPREADYREARQAALADATGGSSSDAVLLPSVSVLKRRWGPWPNVIAAVGLEPLDPFNPRLPRRPHYAAPDYLESLRKAWVQLGKPFTSQAYDRWRQQEREAAEARGEQIEIPSAGQVVHFFGSWRHAVAAALPQDEQQA